MVKKKHKRWISATISEDMYYIVKQKAREIYHDNFSAGLEHIISVYASVWTDLMMCRLRTEVYDAFSKMKEIKEKEINR